MPKTQKTILVSLTERQLAVVLASLRCSQAAQLAIDDTTDDTLEVYFPEIFKAAPGPVQSKELQSLCEHINMADESKKVKRLASAMEEMMAVSGGEPDKDFPDTIPVWRRAEKALKAVKPLTV